MSLLDRFRRKQTEERLNTIGQRPAKPAAPKAAAPVVATAPKKADEKTAVKAEKKEKPAKGGSDAVGKHEEKKIHSAQASATAFHIILQPLVTEKTVRTGTNTYSFVVSPKANKQQIQRAIYELYGVQPRWVRIQNYDGKFVRYGRQFGRTKDWKKAIIGLKEGESIQVTTGV